MLISEHCASLWPVSVIGKPKPQPKNPRIRYRTEGNKIPRKKNPKGKKFLGKPSREKEISWKKNPTENSYGEKFPTEKNNLGFCQSCWRAKKRHSARWASSEYLSLINAVSRDGPQINSVTKNPNRKVPGKSSPGKRSPGKNSQGKATREQNPRWKISQRNILRKLSRKIIYRRKFLRKASTYKVRGKKKFLIAGKSWEIQRKFLSEILPNFHFLN